MCVGFHILGLTTFHLGNTDVSEERDATPCRKVNKTSPFVAASRPTADTYSHSWPQQNAFSSRLKETDPLKRSHFVFPFPWIYYRPGSFPFFWGGGDLATPSKVCGFVLWEEEITSSETRKVLLGQTLQGIHQIWFVASHFTWNLSSWFFTIQVRVKVLILSVNVIVGK